MVLQLSDFTSDISEEELRQFTSNYYIPIALHPVVPVATAGSLLCGVGAAHAMRLAKKQGVKGKAILCGVGVAHLPRSDGVSVSVPTVSPKDGDLLKKLEEAGSAAYHVSSSELRRSNSL